ncbi:MAG: hypothetical protein ACFFGZ_07340 [Candidatus Thorarchaeota archaeon]
MALLFGGLLGGVAANFGAALLEFFPALKELISTRLFELESPSIEDAHPE